MIVSVLLLILLVFAFFKRDRKEEPGLKAAGKKRKLPVTIGSTGLMLHRVGSGIVRRLRGSGPETEKPRLLKSEEEKKTDFANLFGGIYLLLAAGALAGLAAGVAERSNAAVTEIERPAFGETAAVDLVADQNGRQEEVRLEVAGREPNEQEYEALFDEAFQEASAGWLGGNESFSAVRQNLNFAREDERGIQYQFESSEPEKLTNNGTILAEDVPEEGEAVGVSVTLSYGLYEKTYPLEVVLLPKESGPAKTELELALEQANARDRENETMKLPEEAGGEAVTFSRKVLSPYTVLGLAAVIALILAWLPASREKTELKKRDEELAFSYAKTVSGLTAYIGAGMSIRMAWKRMVETYREEVSRGTRPREYVYEEMMLSANELNSGVSEEDVYVRFGRRMGQHRYLKLGNLLAQNVRQGISGLGKALEEESREALEERRLLALKKGEEAGTKLLVPMMIMLGIVILVLVVPAFMMF